MMPKNSGLYRLENLVRMRDPSTPVVRRAARRIGGVDPVDGVGDMNTDAANPAREAVCERAAAQLSSHVGVPEEDAEYEEVDDLIYERTGTLSFSYPPRIVASGERATAADGPRPEATRAPSPGSASPLGSSSLARLVSGLRAASLRTPGVSLLATVDVVGGEPASTAKRRECSAPSPVAEAKANGASAASRQVEPSRGREARSFAPLPNTQRTTTPSFLAKPGAHRSYPSFAQRLLAEVRRIPLAERRAALGVVAAAVVAGVLVAMTTLVPTRAARGQAASRSSGAAVVAERAPVLAPAHVEPRGSPLVTGESAPEPPSSMFGDETAPPAGSATLPVPSPRREPTNNGAQGNAQPATDAPLTGEYAKRAKAPARSKARASTQPRSHEPCDCLPGDPLCGCID